MLEVPGLLCKTTDRRFAEALAAAEAAIIDAGATIMATIDHAKAAAQAGLQLRPTTVLLFGNPAGGTRLMQARPDSAIDLPMKLLVIEDDAGAVRIVGVDPAWIVDRHGGSGGLEPIVAGMRQTMQQVLDAAAGGGSASCR